MSIALVMPHPVGAMKIVYVSGKCIDQGNAQGCETSLLVKNLDYKPKTQEAIQDQRASSEAETQMERGRISRRNLRFINSSMRHHFQEQQAQKS